MNKIDEVARLKDVYMSLIQRQSHSQLAYDLAGELLRIIDKLEIDAGITYPRTNRV